ncbi:MAG: (2Fe-2S)-binding protein [Firmicutes bacterium]|nr:(2Fe-2S)-binding protein [Bacillota bacterium]
MKKVTVTLQVNGAPRTVTVDANARLLDTLREDLRLTGTKEGCGVGECGACSVLLNGELVNSCLVLTAQCDGARVETIEGLSPDGELHPLQAAFIDNNAVQCGFCSPGMLMAAKSVLDRHPEPSEEQIREGMSGVLCRCTGYKQIVDAVKDAARREGNK